LSQTRGVCVPSTHGKDVLASTLCEYVYRRLLLLGLSGPNPRPRSQAAVLIWWKQHGLGLSMVHVLSSPLSFTRSPPSGNLSASDVSVDGRIGLSPHGLCRGPTTEVRSDALLNCCSLLTVSEIISVIASSDLRTSSLSSTASDTSNPPAPPPAPTLIETGRDYHSPK
jgi:hypothetical protein